MYIEDQQGFTQRCFPEWKNSAGFTLMEALIYIALFVIVIGGGLVGAYQIIEGTQQVEEKTIIEAEANFLLRKLDWALSGSQVREPSAGTGPVLRVEKRDKNCTLIKEIEFELLGDGVVIMDGDPISSARVRVSDLEFTYIPEEIDILEGIEKPEALEVVFKVNDQQFGTTTRYLRKKPCS